MGTTEFDVAGLQAKIAAAEPAALAFNGKNAARGALERGVDYGPQEERIGGADVWVLPSTSGAARRFWRIDPWQRARRRARLSADPRVCENPRIERVFAASR